MRDNGLNLLPSISGQRYTLLQQLRNVPLTSWFNKAMYQLDMKDVVDTRDLTLFVPLDSSYENLPYGKKLNLIYYLNDLYYVFLQHISVDRKYSTESMRDGMVIPAGIGRALFINIRKNDQTGVSK